MIDRLVANTHYVFLKWRPLDSVALLAMLRGLIRKGVSYDESACCRLFDLATVLERGLSRVLKIRSARGRELHQWFLGTRTFRAMTGEDGGSDGVDEAYAH